LIRSYIIWILLRCKYSTVVNDITTAARNCKVGFKILIDVLGESLEAVGIVVSQLCVVRCFDKRVDATVQKAHGVDF
jgi:hypothetical protein